MLSSAYDTSITSVTSCYRRLCPGSYGLTTAVTDKTQEA